MKLIVGLGNPGKKYQGTRHNIGWMVIEELARRHGQSRPRAKYEGEVMDATISGEKTLLLCPHTYMNASGRSVKAAQAFFKIDPADVMVICDDLHLAVGRLRIRPKGSDGGQKGLRDIVHHLATDAVPRLRIGIGQVPDYLSRPDYVLGRVPKAEQPIMIDAVVKAADAVAHWVSQGIDSCMNRFNASPEQTKNTNDDAGKEKAGD